MVGRGGSEGSGMEEGQKGRGRGGKVKIEVRADPEHRAASNICFVDISDI